MLKPKTHYEQVPLEVVRKIVDEQITRETAIELDQGTKKRTVEENLLGGAGTIRDEVDIRLNGRN